VTRLFFLVLGKSDTRNDLERGRLREMCQVKSLFLLVRCELSADAILSATMDATSRATYVILLGWLPINHDRYMSNLTWGS
jgi:hypothetical protein